MSPAKKEDSPFIKKCRLLLQRATHQPNADATEAEKSATLEEAAVAMSMLQEMLARHNIEMSDIATAPSEESARGKQQYDASAMYKFQRDLMQALAENNFCMYFVEEIEKFSFKKWRRVKTHVLLGREVNIIACTTMYDYLTSTMDRILPYYGMEKRGKDALAWLGGCAEELIKRLKEKKAQMLAEEAARAEEEKRRAQHPSYAGSTANALVLADAYSSEDDLNTDFLQGLEPGTTARVRRERQARVAAQEEEWRRKRQERDAKIKAIMEEDPTLTWGMAYDMAAYGKTAEEARRDNMVPVVPEKPKTQAQLDREAVAAARRARKQQEQDDREWYKNYQRTQKQRSKEMDPARQAGKAAGREIGLDAQVSDNSARRIK